MQLIYAGTCAQARNKMLDVYGMLMLVPSPGGPGLANATAPIFSAVKVVYGISRIQP